MWNAHRPPFKHWYYLESYTHNTELKKLTSLSTRLCSISNMHKCLMDRGIYLTFQFELSIYLLNSNFSFSFMENLKRMCINIVVFRPGVWGVCFIYATRFALEALTMVGKNYNNCIAVRKGVHFLLKTQNQDGGWGESFLSCNSKVIIILYLIII